MRAALCVLALSLAVVTAAPAAADQNDPRLEALFMALQSASDPGEIGAAEQAIWGIWMESGDGDIDRLLHQGSVHMSLRSYGAALGYFNEVIERRPDFAEGWNKRATVYYLMGEYAKSIADCEKVLALEPRHFGALSGLGLIYAQLEDDARALQAFEQALRVNPHLRNAAAIIRRLKARLGVQDI
ncbi:MAG: tetratricopeptide repeat protein [Alphaproteobacteria bacterium]